MLLKHSSNSSKHFFNLVFDVKERVCLFFFFLVHIMIISLSRVSFLDPYVLLLDSIRMP